MNNELLNHLLDARENCKTFSQMKSFNKLVKAFALRNAFRSADNSTVKEDDIDTSTGNKKAKLVAAGASAYAGRKAFKAISKKTGEVADPIQYLKNNKSLMSRFKSAFGSADKASETLAKLAQEAVDVEEKIKNTKDIKPEEVKKLKDALRTKQLEIIKAAGVKEAAAAEKVLTNFNQSQTEIGKALGEIKNAKFMGKGLLRKAGKAGLIAAAVSLPMMISKARAKATGNSVISDIEDTKEYRNLSVDEKLAIKRAGQWWRRCKKFIFAMTDGKGNPPSAEDIQKYYNSHLTKGIKGIGRKEMNKETAKTLYNIAKAYQRVHAIEADRIKEAQREMRSNPEEMISGEGEIANVNESLNCFSDSKSKSLIVKGIIAEEIGVSKSSIKSSSTLMKDLGADALDVTEIVRAVEKKFKKKISLEGSKNKWTVGDIISQL